MKKDCEVVRDLMPLVLDDVASDGSKHMVSAHVQTCAECAAYMNQLKADLPAGKKSELDSRAELCSWRMGFKRYFICY